MTKTPQPVPAWPRYRLTAAADTTVTVSGPAVAPGPYSGRPEAIAAVSAIAATLRPPRPVLADAVDADGTVWPLAIGPDGSVQENGPVKRTKAKKQPEPAHTTAPPQLRRRWIRRRAAPALSPTPVVAGEQIPAGQPQPAAPFVIPTLAGTSDEATVAIGGTTRRTADEPTVRVRAARRPALPPAEQHDRPAEETAQTPDVPAARLADPRTATAPRPAAVPIPSAFRVRVLAESGRLDEAARMAAELEEAAARAHGPSHRTALDAREILAHITAELGDLPAAVHLYRDAAERRAFQGDTEAANEAAGRAHALWLRIADPTQAITTGETVVAMRSNVPGHDGLAYRQAVKHLARLRSQHQPEAGTPR